ncbi:MAG: glycosyltransferase family 2 protein [Vicinamibacterales bacterium]
MSVIPPASDGHPEVSLVIVTWNGRQHLEACLDAVAAQDGPVHETVLVDNASIDGTEAFVRERYPWVRIVRLPTNAGFAGGSNAGARAARGRYLVFLNNDTVVQGGWLRALREGLDEAKGVAMATSLVVYMDAPAVIDSAGDGMTRAGGAFKRLHGRRAELAARSEEVFGACGAAFIVPTALFLVMGGFDEDFFASHEDVDFSYRAQLRGWRCRYVAEAVVHHKGSATLGRIKSGQVFLAQRNSEWLYWKNTPGPLLVRSGLDHVVYNLAAAVHFARLGLLGTFLRAKWAALAGLGPLLRKRAEVQRARTVSSGEIWRKLEPRWLRLKLSEEKFEIAIARRSAEASAPRQES